jgi:hypothetical protein
MVSNWRWEVDLYGNDEQDFGDQVPEENPENGVADPVTAPAQNVQVPTVSPQQKIATIQPKPEPHAQILSAVKTEEAPTSLPTPPTTQQIPTYEQPLAPDYMEGSVQRLDGAYQNIPVPERTIRPSEMKDEG